ncbi:hypothetical protein [Streptomyces sp. URMC 124]|uniref:hypothetical protein n=1 Tax=Streptomyces sp. URMC 124 TaxID=3423405 RepID=UPI003F1C4A06
MNTRSTEASPHRTTPAWTGGADPYLPGSQSRKNRPAGAAMVLGVTGLSTSVFLFGGLLGVAGLVLGIVALVRSGRARRGRAKAVTGLVTSAIGSWWPS